MERSNLRRFDNGKYVGLSNHEVRSFITPGDDGVYDGNFYVMENTVRNQSSVLAGIYDSIPSKFKIGKDGKMVMIEDNGYPSFRSFPILPAGKIKIGDTWVGRSERAVDPQNRGIFTRLQLEVSYKLIGEEKYKGEDVYKISAVWQTNYGMYWKDPNGDDDLKKAFGGHKAEILVSKKSGMPLLMTDSVDESFLFSDGTTTAFKGKITLFVENPPTVERGKIVPALSEIATIADSLEDELSPENSELNNDEEKDEIAQNDSDKDDLEKNLESLEDVEKSQVGDENTQSDGDGSNGGSGSAIAQGNGENSDGDGSNGGSGSGIAQGDGKNGDGDGENGGRGGGIAQGDGKNGDGDGSNGESGSTIAQGDGENGDGDGSNGGSGSEIAQGNDENGDGDGSNGGSGGEIAQGDDENGDGDGSNGGSGGGIAQGDGENGDGDGSNGEIKKNLESLENVEKSQIGKGGNGSDSGENLIAQGGGCNCSNGGGTCNCANNQIVRSCTCSNGTNSGGGCNCSNGGSSSGIAQGGSDNDSNGEKEKQVAQGGNNDSDSDSNSEKGKQVAQGGSDNDDDESSTRESVGGITSIRRNKNGDGGDSNGDGKSGGENAVASNTNGDGDGKSDGQNGDSSKSSQDDLLALLNENINGKSDSSSSNSSGSSTSSENSSKSSDSKKGKNGGGDSEKENKNDMLVEKTNAGIRLSVRNIQFRAETSEVSKEDYARLDEIAKVLSLVKGGKFLVEGHTARVGDITGEQELSEERARAVARELVKRGVDADSFICRGWGGSKPIAPNTTVKGRAQNRRVEITILE